MGRLALIGDRRQLRAVEAGQPGPISLPLDRVGSGWRGPTVP